MWKRSTSWWKIAPRKSCTGNQNYTGTKRLQRLSQILPTRTSFIHKLPASMFEFKGSMELIDINCLYLWLICITMRSANLQCITSCVVNKGDASRCFNLPARLQWSHVCALPQRDHHTYTQTQSLENPTCKVSQNRTPQAWQNWDLKTTGKGDTTFKWALKLFYTENEQQSLEAWKTMEDHGRPWKNHIINPK